MGMYSVDFLFECVDDNGVDLGGSRGQEMDAFIGYGGKGEAPPGLIVVSKDRTCRCSYTGKLYDPELFGNEDNTAYPCITKGPMRGSCIGIRIKNGQAVNVQVLEEDEDLPDG